MRRIWVAAVVLSAGCASAPIRQPDLTALDRADALVLEGCYDCLIEARDVYRRVGVGRARSLVVERLFETTLLIALREGELAMDATTAVGEARLIARELSPAIGAERILALVDAVAPEPLGTPHKAMAEFRAARRDVVRTVDAAMAEISSGPLRQVFRDYLALSLDCTYLSRPGRNAPPGPRDVAPAAPPLIVFRTATCGLPAQPPLYRLRLNDPRFVEASVFLARFDLAVAEQIGPGRAGERLAEALVRFPSSPLVTLLSGNYFRFVADCERAVDAYDRTVALRVQHEQARLGRVMCLSYLNRHQEAIDGASDMIGRDLDLKAEAYYWRAWNERARQALDRARADIDEAKRLSTTGEILTLAGMIEHDQDDLPAAERDLRLAIGRRDGESNCTALWYLGMVHHKQKLARPSGSRFEDAMGCYRRAAAYMRDKLDELRARPDADPAWVSAQTVRLEKMIAESFTQHHAAALHAATAFATAEDIPAARRLVEIAAADPVLAEPVAKLKEWLRNR